MAENNGKVKPFGLKDKLGYMFGDFGNDFTFILSSMFLLKFYIFSARKPMVFRPWDEWRHFHILYNCIFFT